MQTTVIAGPAFIWNTDLYGSGGVFGNAIQFSDSAADRPAFIQNDLYQFSLYSRDMPVSRKLRAAPQQVRDVPDAETDPRCRRRAL